MKLHNGSEITGMELAANISRGRGHWHYDGWDYHFDEKGQLVADGEVNLVVEKPRSTFVLKHEGNDGI